MPPLSEREQQILDELEKELNSDGVSSRPGRDRAERSGERLLGLKVGILVFVTGIVLLVWFFASGFLVAGVAAFAAMVGGIVMGASSMRAEIGHGSGLAERIARAVGGWEQTLRNRYGDRDEK